MDSGFGLAALDGQLPFHPHAHRLIWCQGISVSMRNTALYVLLGARPISGPEKNGDGPDEGNAKINGMIEGGRLFNGLSRNCYRLIRIALKPESPSQGDASSVAVIESEVESIDTLRNWGTYQCCLQMPASAGLVPYKMIRAA